jgi:hypothetical protein
MRVVGLEFLSSSPGFSHSHTACFWDVHFLCSSLARLLFVVPYWLPEPRHQRGLTGGVSLCSLFVRGRVLACSGWWILCTSPELQKDFSRCVLVAHGGFLAIYTPRHHGQKLRFLIVRSLFDRTSAIPSTAWSQAQIFGLPGRLISYASLPA